MAPAKADTSNASTGSRAAQKLPRLPKHARVQKRPILRPAIPSPYAGADQQKIVYISAKTPFVSAVKRVRKLLAEIQKRSTSKVDFINGPGNDKQRLRKLEEQILPTKDKKTEEVFLKATNRAIEKALGIALYFQKQENCQVRLKTGTVGVVDDIVEDPNVDDDATEREEDGEGDETELPESRVRKMTFIEASITLK